MCTDVSGVCEDCSIVIGDLIENSLRELRILY